MPNVIQVIASAGLVFALAGAASPPPLETVVDIPLTGGSNRLDYQSLDPQRGLLFVAHLGSSRIHVVDTHARKVRNVIANVAGVHGVLAVPSLGRVYASATNDNQAAVIDEKTLSVIARVPTGKYPDGLAYASKARRIFVSNEEGGSDTVIDVDTNKAVGTVELGGEAGNTQYDPVADRVLVCVQTLNAIAEIDPHSAKVLAKHPLAGADHNHGLYIDAPKRLAYVACEGSDQLLVVDLKTWQVKAHFPVGHVPDVLAFDEGRQLLYVASEGGVVSVFKSGNGGLTKLAEGFEAKKAHTVAVDPRTHEVYLPLQDVGGRPVLRIATFDRE